MTLLEELESGVDPGNTACDLYFAMLDRGWPILSREEAERLTSAPIQFQNEPQRLFFYAYEAVFWLSNYSFIKIIEQQRPFEEYSKCLVAVGFPKCKAVFDRLIALLPADLQLANNTSALIQFGWNNPAPMEELLLAFFEAAQGIDETFRRYLLDHRDDFADFWNLPSSRERYL